MKSLLDDISKYHEEKLHKIKELLSSKDEYSVEFVKTNIAEVIGQHMSIMIEYSVLGCYNTASSIWTWAWKMMFLERSLAADSLAVKQYEKKLKKITPGSYSEETDIDKYLYCCSNGYFFIYYKTLSELINFGLYITQGEWIFPHIVDNNGVKIIEFLIAKKIIQYKKINGN